MSAGSLEGLSPDEKREILRKLLKEGKGEDGGGVGGGVRATPPREIPERWYRFDQFPGYQELLLQNQMADLVGLRSPFFLTHEGRAGATTVVEGRELLNFSSYNYLGLSGDPQVNAAMMEALERYGSSAGASRVVSGERPVQRELEEALAALVGAEAAVAFVGGHATNVTTIGHLMGPRDLILHDQLIHNSALVGAQLARSHRKSFRHNDWEEVDAFLTRHRHEYEKVLVVVEGLYSMDGDVPPIPRFVELRERHRVLLMVDEAHSLGVLGAGGGGVREHFELRGDEVDIWMGTLSKSFAAQGGFIAGSRALVEYLKFTAPGFVYSVGISPPLAAAALEAVRLMEEEPERVARLQANGRRFLERARAAGLDVGLSEGHAVVPILLGSSLNAVRASNGLFERGVNVQPIIHPAVPERLARLRFFLSAEHTAAQIDEAVTKVREVVGEGG